MKILMIVPSFPKIHDICMLNQITGLIDRGHDVWIYAPKLGDTVKVQRNVITYDLLKKTIIGVMPFLNEYDIVVFQLGHKAMDIKKLYGYQGKVVVCIRGYDITGFVKENSHAYDQLFNSCDLFMPVCNSFKKILCQLGCPQEKIIVHHSGIDCNQFFFRTHTLSPKGDIKIMSVGRYVEKKGFTYAIRAIAQLVKKYPTLHYTIIGEGPLKKEYRKLIRRLGIKSHVTLDGWYTHDEYKLLLDGAHIFVAPSVTAANNDQEGIPNVLKEAMATGLLAIATHHSGISELIEDKVSGFLVPERNSVVLASVIDSSIRNFNNSSVVQIKGRYRICQEFDTEKLNDQLETIFVQLINQSKIREVSKDSAPDDDVIQEPL